MCDGHLARIFANFKYFLGELLVSKVFQEGGGGGGGGGKIPKFQEFSRSDVQIPGACRNPN